MPCKDRCLPFKAEKPIGIGRYASGQKRCQTCEIFLIYAGLWCPCCGCRLRTKPRNTLYKQKLRGIIEAKVNSAKMIMEYKDGGYEITPLIKTD